MKHENILTLSTSPSTQPARKLRSFASLSLRRRSIYGRERRCYAGKELDNETGLYYYGARYLDPKTGRWLSGDPAIGEYVPSAPVNEEAKKRNGSLPGMGGVFNCANLHVYHYAGNNPVKYVDPDGRELRLAPGTDPRGIAYYNKAIDYIKSSRYGARLIELLEGSENVYTIRIASEFVVYNSKKKEITWNPYAGMLIKGNLQSSSISLVHELGHALQDDRGNLEGRTRSEIEEEAVDFIESPIARQLNEPYREDYTDITLSDYKTVTDPTYHTHVDYE